MKHLLAIFLLFLLTSCATMDSRYVHSPCLDAALGMADMFHHSSEDDRMLFVEGDCPDERHVQLWINVNGAYHCYTGCKVYRFVPTNFFTYKRYLKRVADNNW